MTPTVEGQIGTGLRTLLNNNGLSAVKVVGYEVRSHRQAQCFSTKNFPIAQLGHCRGLSGSIGESALDAPPPDFPGFLYSFFSRCKMQETHLLAWRSTATQAALRIRIYSTMRSRARYEEFGTFGGNFSLA